ncbi:hypothetical protein DUNSADRAFT_10488 [Dunaliella salina]|uniref:Secreted protein n=1 Tax=Dunaliella salina TaxID=3046 RepID=A0ABQ7GF70_DUNSA|nr:hypothetical protein DUNSADRAFT_10488 [Dunaliella salina]|eukprot:KAF5833250.1 hypothetical protein DUNSADRAFT_10488 [Dunaliella salina]
MSRLAVKRRAGGLLLSFDFAAFLSILLAPRTVDMVLGSCQKVKVEVYAGFSLIALRRVSTSSTISA